MVSPQVSTCPPLLVSQTVSQSQPLTLATLPPQNVQPFSFKSVPVEDGVRQYAVPLSKEEGFLGAASAIALMWTVLFVLKSEFWKHLFKRYKVRYPQQQIPCFSCRYFKQNLYLQCAVQPSLVLKQEAMECPDYCARALTKTP